MNVKTLVKPTNWKQIKKIKKEGKIRLLNEPFLLFYFLIVSLWVVWSF